MKKVLSVLSLLLLIILGSSITVTAAPANTKNQYSVKPTEGKESPYPGVAYSSVMPPSTTESTESLLTSSYEYDPFYVTNCQLSLRTGTTLQAYTVTSSAYTEPEIGYNVYFQQWNGYGWVDINSSSGLLYDADYISGTHYLTVAGGKYYRIVTQHYIYDGVSDFWRTTVSDYLYVK